MNLLIDTHVLIWFITDSENLPVKTKQTYKEIAAQLNVSQKTVENQMGSALKKLKSILQKEHYFLMMV